jgi:endonuclease/exonuclease/phosphatase family metal-dependent hydrolase
MTVRVMTWNVENFFPTNVGAGPKTPAEFDAKVDTLVRVIQQQRPDVLALQEVGDDKGHALPRSLEAQLASLGNYAPVVSKHPDGRGIRCAILVKKPSTFATEPELVVLDDKPPLAFDDVQGHPLETMGRGAVHVRLDVAGRRIHVITAHLKSKLLEFPNDRFTTNDEDERLRVAALALTRRTAEAAALRIAVCTLRKQNPREAVVVTGDLNDGPEAATTQMLYGPPGNQPGTGGFDRPRQGDAERLFNLTGLIPAERRYSRIFKGQKELIDHILVSGDLVLQNDATHKRRPIWVDAVVDYGAGGPQGVLASIDEQPAERQGKPASDHAPVVAELDLG